MQVDSDNSAPRRSSAGQGQTVGDARLPPYRVHAAHVKWLREQTGGGGRGSGLVAEFIRTLMAVAVGLGLTLDEWQAVARSPARFREAIRREMGKED